MINAIFGFIIGGLFGFCIAGLFGTIEHDDYGEFRESSENEEDRQTPSK